MRISQIEWLQAYSWATTGDVVFHRGKKILRSIKLDEVLVLNAKVAPQTFRLWRLQYVFGYIRCLKHDSRYVQRSANEIRQTPESGRGNT